MSTIEAYHLGLVDILGEDANKDSAEDEQGAGDAPVGLDFLRGFVDVTPETQ